MLLNKGGKRLAGQGVALYLRKDMVRYDVQLRHQLCTTGTGLEGFRSRRKVVVLNVNDVQSLLNCPINRLVDFCNDSSVIFRDVILQVDYDQCAVFHIVFLHKLFRLFSGSKDHHHFIGKTAVSVLPDNFVTFKPLCYGKLFVIYCQGIVPVHIAEKSEK